MIKSPCYDSKTCTNCPDRHVGCRSTCPEWKRYEAMKQKEYADRARLAQLEADLSGFRRDSVMRMRKGKRVV